MNELAGSGSTGAPVSRSRTFRVHAIGRSRVLVPPQPVPRRVTIVVAGSASVWISSAQEAKLRMRRELPHSVELPPAVSVAHALAPGEGRWVLSGGPIVPVFVTIEYPWDQDPAESLDDAVLLASRQDPHAYDEVADRGFAGLLCDDPWARMVLEQVRQSALQEEREAAGLPKE